MTSPIHYLGDSILRGKCKLVKEITDEIKEIAQKLLSTMKAHNGLGLAAPQIGFPWRLFAISISDQVNEDENPLSEEPKIFINPIITTSSKKTIILNEGCLSIPGFYEEIERPAVISVKAIDLDGNAFEEKDLFRWRGRCIQHEIFKKSLPYIQ